MSTTKNRPELDPADRFRWMDPFLTYPDLRTCAGRRSLVRRFALVLVLGPLVFTVLPELIDGQSLVDTVTLHAPLMLGWILLIAVALPVALHILRDRPASPPETSQPPTTQGQQ